MFRGSLKKILTCVQEVEKGAQNGEEAGKARMELQTEILRLKEVKRLDEFIHFLSMEYGDNSTFYISLLKFLAIMTDENEIVCELIHSMALEALNGEEDYFEILTLKNQFISDAFHLGKRPDIYEDWEFATYFRDEMQKQLGMSFRKIPAHERNRDYVIIATTQFLGMEHAPTRFVYEFCRLIENFLHKEVFLISEKQETDIQLLLRKDIHLEWIRKWNYLDMSGRFSYKANGYEIEGYQVLLKKENLIEMQKLVKEIYDRKPYCVWCFGGIPAFASAMQQFTTLIYMGFNQGYPGIPADIVVNYFPDSPIENRDEREFLLQHDVEVKDIEFTFQYADTEEVFQRCDYQIPDAVFCMAIVGNRIESDCTDSFLNVLKQVMENESECYAVFIGDTDEEFENRVKEKLACPDRIRFLGQQANERLLRKAIAITDLFVNPPRIGGGTGGILAMKEGKPIVTLNMRDVASFAGKKFFCERLEEYSALIRKYINDPDFYHTQSRNAQRRDEELRTSDEKIADMIAGVLELEK